MTRFDGPDVTRADAARLTSQLERVKAALQRTEWLTLRELAEVSGGSEASVSARLRDLRKPRFGGYRVERRRVVRWCRGRTHWKSMGLWQYRLLPPLPTGQQEMAW